MLTSAFSLYAGPGRISIARRHPMNTPKGFKVARFLAPGPWFNSVPKAEYVELFEREILGPLDPAETWGRLHDMVGPGVEPVLLCWEKLHKHDDWCHRTMVAEWFKRTLDKEVKEYLHPTLL